MRRPGVPDIAPADLRDPANPATVDRVWRRLQRTLTPSDPGPRRPRHDTVLIVGASAVALVCGLLAGRALWAPRSPVDLPAAELPRDTPAAERAAAPTGSLRSATLDGEPANPLLASSPPIVLPSPPAALPLPWAASSSPHATSPPHLDSSPAPTSPGPVEPAITPPAPARAATWRSRHAEGDLAGALEILHRAPGGADAAIAAASTAQELMDISDVLRVRGGDRSAALRALARVVDRFPGDANAPIAAYTIGKMLAERGDHDQAAHHFDRARSLGMRVPLAPDDDQ